MNNLIKAISKDNQLDFQEFDFQELKTLFAYFKEQDDFFIFIFSTSSELIENVVVENDVDLEYALNRFVHDYKNVNLQDFKNRSIDNNLSLIIVLEESEENELTYLYKIEENPFNSKKYILLYRTSDLEALNSEIEAEENMIKSLNKLAITNSNLLQNTEKSWYKLLMRLFIKIPFLNYTTLSEDSGSKKLDNLEELILAKLDSKQELILNVIMNEYDPKNTNIETFVSSLNLKIKDEE
jgi:hypothetical protein